MNSRALSAVRLLPSDSFAESSLELVGVTVPDPEPLVATVLTLLALGLAFRRSLLASCSKASRAASFSASFFVFASPYPKISNSSSTMICDLTNDYELNFKHYLRQHHTLLTSLYFPAYPSRILPHPHTLVLFQIG